MADGGFSWLGIASGGPWSLRLGRCRGVGHFGYLEDLSDEILFSSDCRCLSERFGREQVEDHQMTMSIVSWCKKAKDHAKRM